MRRVILLIVFFIVAVSSTGMAGAAQDSKKILILGFDGMDPVLLENYMEEGLMPNFKRLADEGDFKPLTTSMPPQSPVAWSNLITGMNPGGHGIFDFIARDPKNYLPYLSTSKTIGGESTLKLGDWIIPFSKAETLLLRKGKAFWEVLDDNGIPATVVKIPANFPPNKTGAKTLSGMGTPDILGTYGTFTFYTTRKIDDETEVTSGKSVNIDFTNNSVKTKLTGPPNPFRADNAETGLELKITVDPQNPVALIQVDDNKMLLKEGEWSDWAKVEFKLAPLQSLTGICRFYLMKVRPDFELYVSPINIDPFNASTPISTPDDYSAQVAEEIGYFYTQGMPEDTKALDQDFLHNDDFLELSEFIKNERIRMLDMELKRFDSGLLFVYFPTTDPVQHMFWRNTDKKHPAYNPKEAAEYSNTIKNTYKAMDVILGNAVKRIDGNTTLIVLSDHGFGSFRRYFHLNTWLKENGYLNFTDKNLKSGGAFFENVDFKQTRAYALGFNGIYINLRGREGIGIVSDGREKEKLLDELIKKLEAVIDPATGDKIINKIYKREELYSGEYVEDAPDLLVGYNRGYRASWETALGKVPEGLFGDNMKKWSGTHLWDYRLVPGVVLSNRKIKAEHPALFDIAPTILKEFGIKKDRNMVGKPIFQKER